VTEPPASVDVRDHIGRRVVFAGRSLRAWFEARLAEQGATLQDWILLLQAHHADIELSQAELAERMGIGPPALVRHLDRLEGAGLLVRRRDPRDRRITRISLTDAGRARQRQLVATTGQLDAELRALATEEELVTFFAVLDRLVDHVRGPWRPPSAPDGPRERDEP
jgi:MarR family transcriptional regulator for hemolysin